MALTLPQRCRLRAAEVQVGPGSRPQAEQGEASEQSELRVLGGTQGAGGDAVDQATAAQGAEATAESVRLVAGDSGELSDRRLMAVEVAAPGEHRQELAVTRLDGVGKAAEQLAEGAVGWVEVGHGRFSRG